MAAIFRTTGRHWQNGIDGVFGAHIIFCISVLFVRFSIVWFPCPETAFINCHPFLFYMLSAKSVLAQALPLRTHGMGVEVFYVWGSAAVQKTQRLSGVRFARLL
jgi:hypothetical protein